MADHDRDSFFSAGRRLGPYELRCPVGQGGMAEVWLARQMGTRGFLKPVAIKSMLPSIRKDPEAERMFLREATVASRIRHPNVAEILDLGEDGGTLYLVMEWVQGEPLNAVYNAAVLRGGLPLAVAVRIGWQVATGLHAAHELLDEDGRPVGLVHRDVSPHNVLAGFNGVVKVVDFGIAKVTTEADQTEFGQVKGKLAYMAPEQIRFEPLDRRTDVFATGVLLYLLTTGRHPFKREDPHDTALAICSPDPALPPTRYQPGYPTRLESVLLRALAKDPAKRHPTARALADDLLRAMPPSFKPSDHDALATYLRELLPERHAFHVDLLRSALDAPAKSSNEGAGKQAKSAQSHSTLRAVAIPTAAELGEPVVELEPEPEPAPPSRATLRPRRRLDRRVAFALAGGLAVGVLGIVEVSRGPRPASPPLPVAATRSPALVLVAPPPAAPSATAAVPAPALPAVSAAPAAPTAPGAPAPKRERVARKRPVASAGLKDPYSE